MKKNIINTVICLLLILLSQSCSKRDSSVKICILKGPTGMGIVKLMENAETISGKKIEYRIFDDPQLLAAELIKGDADIAALPSNVAAMLFNKGLRIKALAVNALGSIYILSADSSVKAFEGLSGKNLYISGKGATPDIMAGFISKKLSIQNVRFNYKFSSHSDLASAMLAGYAEYTLLPEPFVSLVLSADTSVRVICGLDSIFESIAGFPIPMGCIVAAEGISADTAFIEEFLKEYEKSVESLSSEADSAAELIFRFGILNSSDLAYKAIPRSGIVFIRGSRSRNLLSGYYGIIYSYNADAIGGSVPDSSFYYGGEAVE